MGKATGGAFKGQAEPAPKEVWFATSYVACAQQLVLLTWF
jgi:hypothetical protein